MSVKDQHNKRMQSDKVPAAVHFTADAGRYVALMMVINIKARIANGENEDD